MIRARIINAVKVALWNLSPNIFEQLVPKNYPQTFSIGIYSGNTPLNLQPAPGVRNPVLTANDITDVPAGFVADPFMIQIDNTWYMFFEVFDRIARQGKIGLAVSPNGKDWDYRAIVLCESFHIAYPRVFLQHDRQWMIPDTPGHGIRLYEAEAFPYQWNYVGTIIEDTRLVDPTFFECHGQYWILACTTPCEQQQEMKLYHAEEICGDWTEHILSPFPWSGISNARQGGSPILFNRELYRFAQDGVPDYGNRVRVYKVDQIDTKTYSEFEVEASPVLQRGEEKWNSGGMHHLDAHELSENNWIACVDGWHLTDNSPRS